MAHRPALQAGQCAVVASGASAPIFLAGRADAQTWRDPAGTAQPRHQNDATPLADFATALNTFVALSIFSDVGCCGGAAWLTSSIAMVSRCASASSTASLSSSGWLWLASATAATMRSICPRVRARLAGAGR
jgi:hypothetical protein